MASSHQTEFVDNIESSIRALASQTKGPPTISAVMEDAGYDAAGLFSIVQRLKEGKEKDLLSRLRSAFEHAKKMPLCLESVKPHPDGFHLRATEGTVTPEDEPQTEDFEPQVEKLKDIGISIGKNIKRHADAVVKLPPQYEEYTLPKPTIIHSPPTDDEAAALAQILTILRPLRHQGRSRILGASSLFYGVGE